MHKSTPVPHFIFIRRLPDKLMWGGLEKVMMDWFERIDYDQCSVSLIVSKGGGDLYVQHIKALNLPIAVIEFPFRLDFRYIDNFFVRFITTFQLFRSLKPHQIIFSQGSFVDFDLAHVMAASWASGGNVYMHENSGTSAPLTKQKKYYFGFIPSLSLWWLTSLVTTDSNASRRGPDNFINE